MKTKEQIQSEMFCGDLFTSKDFLKQVNNGSFNKYDGIGYFHDGEKETNVSVWSSEVTLEYFDKYPYVCWYNK